MRARARERTTRPESRVVAEIRVARRKMRGESFVDPVVTLDDRRQLEMPVDTSVLAQLASGKEMVRVTRKHLTASETRAGLVLDVSDQLLVTNIVSNNITLDGFEVFRLRDITSIESDFRRKGFYERALRLKGITPQPPPAGPAGNMAEAIATFSQSYPLIVVARERIDPGTAWIGRVTEVRQTGVRMQLIDTTAELHQDRVFYRYDSITRLQAGGEYEQTLALVAGLSR